MTASISPVLVRLAPCGLQMRLYVYETGGRALTGHPSKPGGTCVKVCACVLSGYTGCADVHVEGCDKACGRTVRACVYVCVFVFPVRTGEESKRGLHSSASPSSCTPGSCMATCLRGFQYPVCACLRARAAVFTQGMQFIIFVCVSGYYIHSLLHTHAYVPRQMEPEGKSNTLSSPVKNSQQASVVWLDDAPFFSLLSNHKCP